MEDKIKNLPYRVSRISWGAVIAGTLTALAVMTMLNLLGLGIGFTTINPMTETDPFDGLGTGALIWFGLSNLAGLFVGGLIAGRMSGLTANADGGLHGFLSWALFAMLSLFLVTSSVGMMANGLSSAVTGVFGDSASENFAEMMEDAQTKGEEDLDLSFKKIKRQAYSLINKAEEYDILPEDSSEKVQESVSNLESKSRRAFDQLNLEANIEEFFNDLSFDLNENGDLDISVEGNQNFLNVEDMKEYLINNTELSESEIQGLINRWEENINTAVNKAEQYYVEVKKKAIKYSDKAADALATLSISLFIMFFLGSLAAFLGGATASPIRTVSEERKETIYNQKNI